MEYQEVINAISQLTKQKVKILDYPRAIYRIENQ